MGWTSVHIATEKRMELTLEGNLEYKSLLEAAYTNLENARKVGANLHLVDCTLLRSKINRSELFELSNKYYTEWGLPPGTKIALLEPKDNTLKMKAEFFVYAMEKLGWESALFSNRTKALAWLQEN
ncbi:hypothetical protein [Maribacter polysaccharolyticus]|uniref:hypothetical protein n=1 Tax=Maribacter polysaccharolyticus TaxID=3020831 RepID=UPI00237FC6B3|nr:hypothetical protein [Maribacter polysaccharolyticus]MDE3740775.1 hypothetical protein [Maribacter polysaccharolyticus]